MQNLTCHACHSPTPLARPRLTDGRWHAACVECLSDNELELTSTNVFLPLRFRVVETVAGGRELQPPVRATAQGG